MELEPKLLELLRNRGIESEEDIREFLSDKPRRTYDPFLLPDMEEGVDCILSAIEDGQKICIFGDYDADGVTSTTILWEVLSRLTDNLMYYIPSRFGEGYGLSRGAIDRVREQGAGFLVTVDCGSVSVDEVAYARSLGMGVVVTDHHTVSDRMADCPVINPARPDSAYPFPYLAGCGVAFKTAQALSEITGLPKRVLTRTLDLVAIGTIGDIVPLKDENRTLAKYGLRVINTGERKNLDRLIRACGLKPGHVTAENVSFVLVPHINAAGRMEHARLAAELFMTKDNGQADARVEDLIRCNSGRKSAQERIYEECVRRVESDFRQDDFLTVDLPDANEGVTGIAAGKLKDRYYKPAVILTPIGDGMYKGTGRGIEGVNLYDMLKENEELFTNFGGHAAACGFTMKAGALETLRSNLNRQAAALRAGKPELWERHIVPDLVLEADEVNLELAEQFTLLEPCGCQNEKPLVRFRAAADSVRRIGENGKYLCFDAELENMRRVRCIAFRAAEEARSVLEQAGGSAVQVTGSLQEKTWNGRSYLEMLVAEVENPRD